MERYQRVEGHTGFVKDNHSGAVVNTSKSDYQKYIARRNAKNKDDEKIKKIEEEVGSLKNDLSEIKSMLSQIINS